MTSRKRPESTITGRFLLGYAYMSISSHVRDIGLLPTLPEYDNPSVFLITFAGDVLIWPRAA
jgi:hypothetical protein